MNKYNKYSAPSVFGTGKKNLSFSKERMAKADMRRNAAKYNMMRVMKKN